MTPFEIPLSPQPQAFNVSIAGVGYRMRVRWSAPSACWLLDISDVNDIALVQSIPLLTGSDLVGQYAYLGFGFALYVQTDSDTDAVPTFANLGVLGRLYAVLPT